MTALTRSALLDTLSEIAQSRLSEDTPLSGTQCLDSLTLLNIFTYLKTHGFAGGIRTFISCHSIGDLLNLTCGKTPDGASQAETAASGGSNV